MQAQSPVKGPAACASGGWRAPGWPPGRRARRAADHSPEGVERPDSPDDSELWRNYAFWLYCPVLTSPYLPTLARKWLEGCGKQSARCGATVSEFAKVRRNCGEILTIYRPILTFPFRAWANLPIFGLNLVTIHHACTTAGILVRSCMRRNEAQHVRFAWSSS